MKINEEKFAELMNGADEQIIACRSIADPKTDHLIPTGVLGYNCKLCGTPLVASARAAKAIKDGGLALCTECGIEVTERLAKAGRPPAAIIATHSDGQIDLLSAPSGPGNYPD